MYIQTTVSYQCLAVEGKTKTNAGKKRQIRDVANTTDRYGAICVAAWGL